MRDADRHLLRDYNETSVQTPEMALKPGTYYLCVRRDIYLPNCSYNLLLTVVSRSDYAPTDCIYHITAINTPASSVKSSSSRTVTSKPVNKTRIAKAVNRKGRRIFVKWRRNKKASGYQIQFSKKRSFPKRATRGKIIGRNTKTTYTRKLARGRWYVRVRCLKGKRYSSWSKVKTIRIKK